MTQYILDPVASGAAAALVVDDQLNDCEIWARPLADGSMAFALLNAEAEDKTIQIPFRKLGMKGKWAVRDLWRQKDEGVFDDGYAATVPGHATHLVKLTPREGARLKPCLKDIRDNTWRLPFDDDRAKMRPASDKPGAGCD